MTIKFFKKLLGGKKSQKAEDQPNLVMSRRQDSTDSGSDESIDEVEPQFVGEYVLGKSIAHGKFGKVHKCVRKSDRFKAAVKVIQTKTVKTKADEEEIEREHQLMSEIHHPNCVHLIDAFRNEKEAHLVMELCEGGSLFDEVSDGEMSELKGQNVAWQLLCALKYCQQKGIIHRDVKPENILFKDKARKIVKLADFGLSIKHNKETDEPLTKAVGTLHYAAPEVIKTGKSYDGKADVWSLGVTTFVMLGGCFPYYSKDRRKIAEMIMYQPIDFDSDWDLISDEGKDFIKQAMCKNPKKRPSVEALMRHPWLRRQARSCMSPRERRNSH